jgi:hypothetical protein
MEQPTIITNGDELLYFMNSTSQYGDIINDVEISEDLIALSNKVLFTTSTNKIQIIKTPLIFGLPTIMFPLLYGANDGGYSQNNPGPYNTIIDNKYFLNMPSNVTAYGGEYFVFQEYRYNFGRAKITVNVDAIQNGTSVIIVRKAFTSSYGFIGQYYTEETLKNGINYFTVTSAYGNNNVAIEQIGIIVHSPSSGSCTCNVLGVNILFSGSPTIMFPLLYGANDGGYSQNNPGPYNTIIDNKYFLNMPSNVTVYNGEYNVYQEYRYNFGTAKVTLNVNAIQSGTSVSIFRKAFTSSYGFISQYFVLQPLTNGINYFTVTSAYGNSNVGIEQIGIIINSPSSGTCTCNVLEVKILFSGSPTIMFPLFYGANDGVYSQNNPGPYNTIVDNKYFLNMPSNITEYAGEYNVFQEYRCNFGTANVIVNVDAIQSGTSVSIFRKAFTSSYDWIGEYYLLQPLTNGINYFTVTSAYVNNNVDIEQIGIIIKSPSSGSCTCNILGVNILFS